MAQCQDLIWKGDFQSILPDHGDFRSIFPDHQVKSYKQEYNRSHSLEMGSHCDLGRTHQLSQKVENDAT